jgi:hypothetical protein
MKSNPLFTTQLPKVFKITIDYAQGTKITVNSDLVFATDFKEVDSLNFCLLAWANHEFRHNLYAQEKLKEIKKADRIGSGSCTIADYGYFHIIGVGSSHILALFKTLGFDITLTKDELTKKVTEIKFSELEVCEA